MLEPALILFAKTPLPGKVKTRLQPRLSTQQATQVAAVLIEQSVALAQHWPGPVHLAVWPQLDHPLFHRLIREQKLLARLQCPGDLGSKMEDALSNFIQQGRPAAIMGCDVPHCPIEVLRTAAAALVAQRPVLGPSRDGGYYLIGLAASYPSLFEDIAWGTNKVTQQTLQRAQQLGLKFELLPELTDLDTWDDLVAVKESIPGLAPALGLP